MLRVPMTPQMGELLLQFLLVTHPRQLSLISVGVWDLRHRRVRGGGHLAKLPVRGRNGEPPV